MLTAAALLAGGATAQAGTHSFMFGTSNGGGGCSGFTVTTGLDGGFDNNGVWAIVYNPCSGSPNYGQGLVAKTKGLGEVADMSDTVYGQNYGIFSEQINFVLPKKLKAGQPWSLWVGVDGISSFEGNSGVLVNPGAVRRGNRRAFDVVRQLVGAYRGRK